MLGNRYVKLYQFWNANFYGENVMEMYVGEKRNTLARHRNLFHDSRSIQKIVGNDMK